MTSEKLNDLITNFELLDDWEDRYRYLIELGNELPEMSDNLKTAANKVQGCASQVWIHTNINEDASDKLVLDFSGDSDAHIVKGLIAILLTIYSGQPPENITNIDAHKVLDQIGLQEHLTPQRSNGLSSMVERIKRDAANVNK